MSNISDKAVISPKAKIGNNVTIYPFVYIEDDVVVGDDCVLYPNVNLMNGTRLGKGNKIHQNSVISAIPQDFHYCGEKTICEIGEGNIIRENVVINRATHTGGKTLIGDKNFLMEGVEIHNYIIFSSGVIANPGVRVGDCAMIQSGCRFSKDIPPYIVAGGHPIKYGGINGFVIDQCGISEKVKSHIANAYRLVFHGLEDVMNACVQIEEQIQPSPEINNIVKFLKESKLGLITKL